MGVDDDTYLEDAFDREERISVEQNAPTPPEGYEIISGCLIPKRIRGPLSKGYSKYPFDQMKVGQSVIIKGSDAKLWMAISRYYQRAGKKGLLTTRSLGGGRYQVWKIAEVTDD